MPRFAPYLAPILLITPVPGLAAHHLPPGIWTNTEDAYFAEEEGREAHAEVAFEVAEDGRWRSIDAFGAPQGEWSDAPIVGLRPRDGGSGWQIFDSELRQARPMTCWVSVRKYASKPDGAADWTFTRNLDTFDQGGRVFVPGNGEAPDVTIRLRNVTWAAGSRNRPSFVLYVHKTDPVRAESYSWASPDAALIGINLRWVQGSCSLVEEAAPIDRAAQLAAQGERWRESYEAQDWDALRELYAEDAVLMTQGQNKIVGADAIIAFLRRIPDAGGRVAFEFANEEVALSGADTVGSVTAKYRMTIDFPERDPVTVAGRSFLVYEWEGSRWKLWRDIDNFAPDATAAGFPD